MPSSLSFGRSNVVITANLPLNGDQVDQTIFIADRPYRVLSIRYVHATKGTNGSAVNLQVTKDTGTDAPGAGTDLLSNNSNAGFDCKGTDNTVQSGAFKAGVAPSLKVGERLSLDYAGTLTALAGVQVTAVLKPM